jgi:hypothetical protein
VRLRFDRYPLGPLALASAVLGAIVAPALPVDHLQPDSLAFEALARSILAGTGLRYQEALIPGLDLFAFRAPGYPVFLALALPLGGVTAVLALQGALNGLSAAVVGAVAGELAGTRAAWIAFALRLAWPVAWRHASVVESEIPYETLCLVATWLVLVGVRRRAVGFALLAGVLTASAILVRPVGLGLAAALGLWLLLRRQPRAAAAFALAVLVAWAPWPVRNARVLHAFVPFTTNGGATAWAGTTDGQVLPAYLWMGRNVEVGEIGFDRHFRALTLERMRDHPAHVARMTAQRAFIYLGPIRGRAPRLWLHRFAMLAAAAALALGAWRSRLLLPGLVWLAQGAVLVPVYLIDRYRFPTEWCVIVAAAIGLVGLAGRWGARRTTLAAGAALLLSLAASLALAAR